MVLKKMVHNIFLQIRNGKRPLFCPPPMEAIWQLSIIFRLTDWLINILVYLPSLFHQSAFTLLSDKFSGALFESPSILREMIEWQVGRMTILSIPMKLCQLHQKSRDLVSYNKCVCYIKPFRYTHSLLKTALCNRVHNFSHFTYKHALFAWHFKLQIKENDPDRHNHDPSRTYILIKRTEI